MTLRNEVSIFTRHVTNIIVPSSPEVKCVDLPIHSGSRVSLHSSGMTGPAGFTALVAVIFLGICQIRSSRRMTDERAGKPLKAS